MIPSGCWWFCELRAAPPLAMFFRALFFGSERAPSGIQSRIACVVERAGRDRKQAVGLLVVSFVSEFEWS